MKIPIIHKDTVEILEVEAVMEEEVVISGQTIILLHN